MLTRVHSLITLALSVLVFTMAVYAAEVGSRHDGLYAVAGRPDAVQDRAPSRYAAASLRHAASRAAPLRRNPAV